MPSGGLFIIANWREKRAGESVGNHEPSGIPGELDHFAEGSKMV